MENSSDDTPQKRVKRLPTGQEVMKRKAPSDLNLRPTKFEFDPKKAYTTDQMAEIGAITLKWNQIEAHIDFIGSQILFAKVPSWLRLATDRTLSTNAKLKLLEECLKYVTMLDKKACQCIHDCFSQIVQCRAYRNAIIHHRIYDHEKGIGSYIDESNSPYQILVSIEALKILYNILDALLAELWEIDLLFRIETDAQRPGQMSKTKRKFEPFSDDVLRTTIIPEHTQRIVKLQAARKNLQKLPTFPDADLVRLINERDDGDAQA